MLILFYYSLQTLPTDSLLQTTLHQKIEQNLCSDCAFLFTSLWSYLDSTQWYLRDNVFNLPRGRWYHSLYHSFAAGADTLRREEKYRSDSLLFGLQRFLHRGSLVINHRRKIPDLSSASSVPTEQSINTLEETTFHHSGRDLFSSSKRRGPLDIAIELYRRTLGSCQSALI